METTKFKILKDVLIDVTVEADLSGMLWRGWRYYNGKEEERAKDLEKAVKDFENFLHDHRSQDLITLNVNRKYADLCSNCKQTLELDKWDGKTICACCGAELDE